MDLLKVAGKLRVILGKITDVLLKGRQLGLWNEKETVVKKEKK